MIEVEYNRISFSAIDARVICQMSHQPGEVPLAMCSLESGEVGWIGDRHTPRLPRTGDGADQYRNIHAQVI